MKKIYKIFIPAVITIILGLQTKGQEWSWEWAESISCEGPSTWTVLENCDWANNIYSYCPYDTMINIGDTVFYHPEQYSNGHYNKAIIITNSEGKIINAIDMYTLPGDMIYSVSFQTDNSLNLYITAHFSTRMFIQGAVVNHCNTPYPYLPDVVILKLDPSYNIIWSKMIGGTYSDNLIKQFTEPDGGILLLTEQIGSPDPPATVSFFEQDTVISDHDFTSVSKLDSDGNMLWRKDFHGELTNHRMASGDDGNYYFWGRSYSDIVVDEDTLFKPENAEFSPEFLVIFDSVGIISYKSFFDFPVYPYEMAVDVYGDYFVSGSIYDTTVIAQDTIIVPEESYYAFVGKFNHQFEPVWYHVIPRVSGQTIGIFKMNLDGETLVFASSSNKNIQIADTLLTIGFNLQKGIFGEFDANGDLVNIVLSEGNKELQPVSMILDNCNNPVISGDFTGWAYMGEDTLISYSYEEPDGFIAKMRRTEPLTVDLGPDTLACDGIALTAPADYTYYIWNNIPTSENWFNVVGSGSYTLACAGAEGCWLYDTVIVTIHPGFVIELGQDTSLFETDTIVLSVPGIYESYLWSDGSTTNSISVIGNQYGLGTFPIWVEVSDGPCIESDTIVVTVKSQFGIDESNKIVFKVSPNPFNDKILLKLNSEAVEINIADLNGVVYLTEKFTVSEKTGKELDLSNLPAGVYFLRLKSSKSYQVAKIVKK